MTPAQARRLQLVATYGELESARPQADGSYRCYGHGPGESWRRFTIQPDGRVTDVREDGAPVPQS